MIPKLSNVRLRIGSCHKCPGGADVADIGSSFKNHCSMANCGMSKSGRGGARKGN